MAGSFFYRVNNQFKRPPPPDKSPSAIRFGILGAARIAPAALIKPAKTHPDVVIAAVACRDAVRGDKYARQHHILKTFSGPQAYHELIADESVDAVYIALPNGLHFEWAMRALQAGKHVLVEKPMTNTPEEAQQIFALAEEKQLIALEAVHCMFHPALHRVRDIVGSGDLGNVKSVVADFTIPSILSPLFFQKNDPRFQYELGGGCMMDMGVYPIAVLRFLIGSDTTKPLDVTSAAAVGQELDPPRVDRAMHATYTIPLASADGRDPERILSAPTAETRVDFGTPGRGLLGLLPRMIKNEITISLENGEILLYNFVSPGLFHYIRIEQAKGKGQTRYEQAYTFDDERAGDRSWDSYRYQLEAFVDKVRGRAVPGWPEASTVVTELETLQRVYVKAGMPPRCSSSYKHDQLTSE